MKNLIYFFSLLVVGFLVTAGSLFAQDSLRIAFVASERDQILGYTAGRAQADVILQSDNDAAKPVTLSHMAVLAATADGQHLLIGGKLNFIWAPDHTKDSVQGIMRIDLPFKFNNIQVSNRKNIRGIQVLAEMYVDVPKPLPVGTLNSTGTDWYAVWCKNGGFPFTLYHGKFDGTGNIDSLPMTGENTAFNPLGGFHMTNLCVNSTGTRLVCCVMDNLSSQSDHQQRFQLFRWLLDQGKLQASNFMTNQLQLKMKQSFGRDWNIDSSFGCVMRIRPEQTDIAELLFTFNNPGDYDFYDIKYDNGNPGIPANGNGRSLSHLAIPDSIALFCGKGAGQASSYYSPDEVSSEIQRYNNAGDFSFLPDGHNVIFIVHDNDENILTAKKTGIWLYDLEGSGAAELLFNDPNKIERQPIFVGYSKFIPPAEGKVIFDKNLIEIADSVEIGKSKDFTFKMSNPTNDPVNVTLIEKTGANELDFSQPVGTPPFLTPQQLAGEASVDFTVTFTPSAAGLRTATITAHWGSNDSTTSVVLKGYGKLAAGVAADPEHAFNVSVNPNPFNARTHVTITGKENNTYDVSFRDVLGRAIELPYPSYQYFAGGMLDFDIDAKALGLAPGVYYLHVKAGGNVISRQIVYIK
jgi:hypothetical protein